MAPLTPCAPLVSFYPCLPSPLYLCCAISLSPHALQNRFNRAGSSRSSGSATGIPTAAPRSVRSCWQNIPTSLPSPCAGSDGQQFKPPPARPARPCHRDAGRDLRGRVHHPSDACSMTPSPASCAKTILWCRHSQERLPGREAFPPEAFPPKMSGTVGRFYLFPPIS